MKVGVWYYLACPEHKEVLFLGRYEGLGDAVGKMHPNYDPYGVVVGVEFLEEVVVPQGVGAKKFVEKHRGCTLLLGDDSSSMSIETRFDEFEGWLEYFTYEAEPHEVR
jgi:hypothetical protein